MALLNPPEFMPEVVRMLTEAVADGIDDREELMALAAPGEVGGDRSAVVKNSLSAAVALGLVIDDDKALAVSPDVGAAFTEHQSLRPAWGDLLLKHLINNESRHDAISENVGDKKGASKGVRDLYFGATWFLAQNASGAYSWSSDDSSRNVEFLLAQQIGKDAGSLTNDTRWYAMQRWLIPLGLAQPVPAGSGLRPVPSVQVSKVLRREVQVRREDAVPVRELCEVIGREVPLMWPGSARSELAKAIGADPDDDVQAGGIDSSIGQALEHLEYVHQVVLENRSDASQRTLLRASGTEPRPVTHVVLSTGVKS